MLSYGWSGKDLDKPGLQDLLEDIRQGKIDVIVTYKIDRISRALKDFYQFWEILQQHNAKFVSATQNFDTSDSTGMLMLNILLSFAQFERELTREGTLSKMTGRAEKGKWKGGWVPIGYDYQKENQQLVINEKAAEAIRFTFKRTIETRSPSRVANEANDLGYRTKVRSLTTRQSQVKTIGGKRLDEDLVNELSLTLSIKGL